MIQRAAVDLTHLYEADETAWLEQMSERIQQGQLDDLDYPHLGEYLADMAIRDRREVESRLLTLLAHVLKWRFQPDHRTRSWKSTIVEQQKHLKRHAEKGVLRNHAEAALAEAYEDAIDVAVAQSGLTRESFPVECPCTIDQLLFDDLTPEEGPLPNS